MRPPAELIAQGFAPLVQPGAQLLILGSLPGQRSLSAGEYYAHPRNLFWALVGGVINAPGLPALPYAERITALHDAGIGLWDVYASAQRAGSLDSAIRQAEVAALGELVAGLSSLKAVAFNGQTAAKAGRRLLTGLGPELIDLPSSSPAYAALPLARKQAAWDALRPYLAKN